MRGIPLLVLLVATPAWADPSWGDVPALLDSAVAAHADALRACVPTLPRDLGFSATRTKSGTTQAVMPLYGIGGRGPTREEKCLTAAIAKLALPALPPELERIGLRVTLVAAGDPPAKHEKRFDDWRDPVATVANVIDAPLRAALGACDRKPRTVRVVLDLTRGRTRVWLPAWQFHAASGDGSTPPAEARVKACLGKALRGLSPPVLPQAMAELQVAIPIAPPR